MTAAPNYTTIDKLVLTMMVAPDPTAVISARAAVMRKLDAGGLELHKVSFRPVAEAASKPDQRLTNSLRNDVVRLEAEVATLRQQLDEAQDAEIAALIAKAVQIDRRKTVMEMQAWEDRAEAAEQRLREAEHMQAEANDWRNRAEVAEAIVATVRSAVA